MPIRCAFLLSLLLANAAAGAGPDAPALRWGLSADFPGLGAVSALAVDAATGRLAAGDAQGVWLRDGGPSARRLLRRGPVRDLAFARDGRLYAATDQGLFRLDATGEVLPCRLGTGVREVRRILVTAAFVIAATARGAFASTDGVRWSRLDAGLPAGAVDALAARPGSEASTDLWMIIEGSLERARLRPRGDRLVVEHVASAWRAAGVGRDAIDLSTSVPGVQVAVLSRSGIALYRAGAWERLRPAWLPGAEPARLGVAAGRLWLATDRGLLEAASPAGPWRRAAPPAGATPIAALAAGGEVVYAAGVRGLLVGRPESRAVAVTPPAPPGSAREEPTIDQLRVAALRYLDLGPEGIRQLRRGVRRRGWLPRLELRGSYAGARSRQRDHDEAFTSGALRLLYDRERERIRDFGVSAALVWDFADLAFHPESIDVSKEAREVIELRDDVLDEISQLYFERRRALLDLAALPSKSGVEAARLRLRAEELASGLDAWTGGWWSRATRPSIAPTPSHGPEETHR